MKVVAHSDVMEFWQVAGSWLAADPVRNTVALSIVGRLLHGVDSDAILLTVHDGPDVIAAATCTPPLAMVLGAVPPDAAVAIADHVVSEHIELSGVTGIQLAVEAFTAAWTDRTGDEHKIKSHERLYRLGNDAANGKAALTPPTDVPGEAVDGTESDVELLTSWRRAAIQEIFHRPARLKHVEASRMVRGALAMGNGQILWRLGGRPVSLAGVALPREGMSRIGPVYTPPGQRGHGYGSAVTAAAAQWALDRGAEHVVLFTDLANPVSNSIYQRIGFRPVADALSVDFGPVP